MQELLFAGGLVPPRKEAGRGVRQRRISRPCRRPGAGRSRLLQQEALALAGILALAGVAGGLAGAGALAGIDAHAMDGGFLGLRGEVVRPAPETARAMAAAARLAPETIFICMVELPEVSAFRSGALNRPDWACKERYGRRRRKVTAAHPAKNFSRRSCSSGGGPARIAPFRWATKSWPRGLRRIASSSAALQRLVAWRGAQRRAQVGLVFLAEAHVERAGAGHAHPIAGSQKLWLSGVMKPTRPPVSATSK